MIANVPAITPWEDFNTFLKTVRYNRCMAITPRSSYKVKRREREDLVDDTHYKVRGKDVYKIKIQLASIIIIK